MSHENAEACRRAIEAYNREDVDGFVEQFDPAVEWQPLIQVVFGGETRLYRGHAGIRQFMREVDEAFARVRIEQVEIRDLGERIVMSGHLRARGRASGAETESPIGWVLEFSDGRIARMRDYLDPEEALKAANLPDSVASQEAVEIVRGIYADWGVGRFQAGTELFDPSVVLVLRHEFPDAGTYLGVEQIGEYMRGFLEDWDGAVIEAEEFIGAGDSVVVGVLQRAVGKGSGITTEMRYFQVWTLRGGEVIRIESIKERADARAAAGLRFDE